MLNVLKYDHLCKKLTFIGYLCEICSMCENMVVSEVCAFFEVLCSVFDGHYTEYGKCSVSDEENGRHALATSISHRRKRRRVLATSISHWRQREIVYIGVCLLFT
jgi:hypothetical protein